MADITFKPATPEDARELSLTMRQADVDECRACGHTDTYAVLLDSIAGSTMALTARVDGRLACIFGVAPTTLLGDQAAPWMLGTDEVTRHAKALMKTTPTYTRRMLAEYPRLVNMVHTKNSTSVRWLKRLGFTFGKPFEHNGEPFCLFWMNRHV